MIRYRVIIYTLNSNNLLEPELFCDDLGEHSRLIFDNSGLIILDHHFLRLLTYAVFQSKTE